MRHPVPHAARQLAFAIVTEAGRINLSQSGETVTLESLRAALKASQALTAASRDMTIMIRRQMNDALRAEKLAAAKGPEVIDDRIAQMRREAGGFDLAMPVRA
ncbi:MAG: hypothetical protein ACOY4K_00730 [Pseudomonadota bacterium]